MAFKECEKIVNFTLTEYSFFWNTGIFGVVQKRNLSTSENSRQNQGICPSTCGTLQATRGGAGQSV